MIKKYPQMNKYSLYYNLKMDLHKYIIDILTKKGDLISLIKRTPISVQILVMRFTNGTCF